jgi:hypothetical protein
VAWAAWITKENFGGVSPNDDEALGVSQGLFHVGSGIHRYPQAMRLFNEKGLDFSQPMKARILRPDPSTMATGFL